MVLARGRGGGGTGIGIGWVSSGPRTATAAAGTSGATELETTGATGPGATGVIGVLRRSGEVGAETAEALAEALAEELIAGLNTNLFTVALGGAAAARGGVTAADAVTVGTSGTLTVERLAPRLSFADAASGPTTGAGMTGGVAIGGVAIGGVTTGGVAIGGRCAAGGTGGRACTSAPVRVATSVVDEPSFGSSFSGEPVKSFEKIPTAIDDPVRVESPTTPGAL